MRSVARRLVVVLVVLSMLAACGGGRGGGGIAKAPIGQLPPASSGTSEPAPPARRPHDVVAWAHVENLAAWAILFGLDPTKLASAAGEDTSKSLGELASLFDATRPADVAVTLAGEDDVDWAAVVPIQDGSRFLQYARKEYDVVEKKSRYTLTKKKPEAPKEEDDGTPPGPKPKPKAEPEPKKKDAKADKELLCELATKPELAVCGTAKGLAEIAPWLRSRPKLEGADIGLEVSMGPLRRAIKKALAKDKPDDPTADPKSKEDDKKLLADLDAFLTDFDKLTLGLDAKGKEVHFGVRATFRGVESAWSKRVFTPTNPLGKPELLFQLSENASAAIYAPGGGPFAELVTSFDWFDHLPESDKPKAKALQTEVAKLLGKPHAMGYGVDDAAVRKVLGEYRSTKDVEAWQKSLSKAIDGYAVVALTSDVASLEKIAREGIRLSELDARSKPVPAGAPPPKTAPAKSTVRPAPAALGLPKGSFFVDETKEVTDGPAFDPKTHKANTKTKRETKPSTLVFGEAGRAFLVVGLSDDKAYGAAAKKILARKVEAKAVDPYLLQKGLVFGGEWTSLVGAFASHELALSLKTQMSSEDRDKLVADLEGDLGARLPIPFALAADRRGAGGVVTFDVRGDVAAFKALGEHAASWAGLAALAFMIPMMAMMSSATTP